MRRSTHKSRRKDSFRVAVCIDTREGPGRERLMGVHRYAMERNWRLFLLRREDVVARKQMTALRLDGAILFDRELAFHRFLKDLGVTCVEASARNLEFDDAAVFVDDAKISNLAVEHLISVGFEHFGYCGLSSSYSSSIRCESFNNHIKRLGFSITTFNNSRPDGEVAFNQLIQWLQMLPKPVGVLANDDRFGERVLTACRWAGIKVPDEVGVLGVGNDELICELTYPRLSSVALPTMEIGRRAAELLDSLLQGRSLDQRRWPMAPLEVIIRASTDRLPSAHPAIMAAMEFIRTKSNQSIGTDQVAGAVGIPRRTLERRFMATIGQTVHDFLIKMRLRQAKQLLRQSRASLGEVARLCGYSALSAFTRMFTARVGCHPEAYRKQYKEGKPGKR